MNRNHLPKTLLLILLLFYWAVSLRNLTVVPPIYEDEPWIAAAGWKLATEGIFGSDLFAGFYGMEEANYAFLPVFSIIAAAVFKLTGLGLFQLRFEPVVFGLFILVLTYSLGKRLFSPSTGLLAVFLLLFTRTTGQTPSQYTGILLVDLARIGRYDIAVSAFGLAALLVNNELRKRNYQLPITDYPLRFTFYALLGILTALASLSHLYGLFWLVALLLLLVWHKAGWRPISAVAAGFALPWLFYLLFVLSNYAGWLGQAQLFQSRFELLDPGWYWQNLLNEFRRYSPGLAEGLIFRPGFWTAALFVPAGLVALGRQAWRGDRKCQMLFVPVFVIPILYATLLYIKFNYYLIAIAPLFALLLAWVLNKIWRGSERSARLPYLLVRLTTLFLLILIGIEGTSRFVRLERAAATTTAYAEYSAEIQSHLPPGGRIMALHHYWLNFQSWEYRTWYVPLVLTNPDYRRPPLALETALNNVDPTIIFIDRRMRELFDAEPETAQAVYTWMAAQGFKQTAVVEDESYGRMDIYLKLP